MYDTLGKPHKLSNYRGKYIILDFWSSGCYPCLLAGDEIKEVQEKFKNKLTIISITTDYEKSWRDATAKHNISWTNLSDYKGRFAGFCSQFTFDAIPYFVIVDPSGKIIGNWFGYSKNNIYDKVKEFCK
ncbi:MAG: TlpA disulfide reductase family protein [Bacteroidales bacterium]